MLLTCVSVFLHQDNCFAIKPVVSLPAWVRLSLLRNPTVMHSSICAQLIFVLRCGAIPENEVGPMEHRHFGPTKREVPVSRACRRECRGPWRYWNRWDHIQRGQVLAELKRKGCSVRGLEKDIDALELAPSAEEQRLGRQEHLRCFVEGPHTTLWCPGD